MSWSLVEIRSLSVKAARGAGYSWGMAEEAGNAVRWLQARKLPGVAALADYLMWRLRPDNATLTALAWRDAPLSDECFCPVELGVALMDAEQVPHRSLRISHPMLLVPFLAMTGQSGELVWEGVLVRFSKGLIDVEGSTGAFLADECACSFQTTLALELVQRDFNTRVPDSEHSSVAVLASFAHKTYAPATEESRLAGAGAGLSDND